jgi:hypothetical protein
MLPVLKKQKHDLRRKSAFGRALERFAGAQKERARKTRIGFVIDATASRAQTWVAAQKIQAQMFRAVSGIGPMALRLVHFGGYGVTEHGWVSSSQQLAIAMNRVECVNGTTQFIPALSAFLADDEPADAIIVIGDMFEESAEEMSMTAQALKAAGVRVFTFLEGDDEIAASVLQRLAATTGGRFARFGSELPLSDLCEGVSLLAAGGDQAVKRLKNEKVKRLLLAGPSEK